MSRDNLEFIGGSKLQHGKLSNRVYLIHLEPADLTPVMNRMQSLAEENGYTKLFAKIPATAKAPFIGDGFEAEAEIPDFFPDGDNVSFMAKFLDSERQAPNDPDRISRVLETAQQKAHDAELKPLPGGYRLAELGKEDCERMASLYAEIFRTYPFPIFDPEYLAETMDDNFRYFGALHGNDLAALASSEMDGGCVEMTDFATHPEHRSAGLASHILARMEKEMSASGLKTAFTIARSRSFGVNILFSRAGYMFSGTLVNNTGISGRLESMNIWYKPLGSLT